MATRVVKLYLLLAHSHSFSTVLLIYHQIRLTTVAALKKHTHTQTHTHTQSPP